MKANEILNEKEALTVLAELNKHGINAKVTKVEAGYVVKADAPEMKEEEKVEEKAETILPEEKSQGTEQQLQEQKSIQAEEEPSNPAEQAADLMDKAMEEKAEEEMKEQMADDEKMSSDEALKCMAKLAKAGITATMKAVGRKQFAIAVAPEDMDKVADALAEAPEMEEKAEEKKEDEIEEAK